MLSLHLPSDRTQTHATCHTRRHRSCSPTPDRNRHRGTASSRRPGPAPPRGLGPPPREGGSRWRPWPPRPHPSAPPRASPPEPPSGPAFPARLSPSAARAGLSPQRRLRSGSDTHSLGSPSRGSHSVSKTSARFSRPVAPPAGARLRSLAQAQP